MHCGCSFGYTIASTFMAVLTHNGLTTIFYNLIKNFFMVSNHVNCIKQTGGQHVVKSLPDHCFVAQGLHHFKWKPGGGVACRYHCNFDHINRKSINLMLN